MIDMKIIKGIDGYNMYGVCPTCRKKRVLWNIRGDEEEKFGICSICKHEDIKVQKIFNIEKQRRKGNKKKNNPPKENLKVFITKHAYVRLLQRRFGFGNNLRYLDDIERFFKMAFKEGVMIGKMFRGEKLLQYGPFYMLIVDDTSYESEWTVISLTHGLPPDGVMKSRRLRTNMYDRNRQLGRIANKNVDIIFHKGCIDLDRKIRTNEIYARDEE